MNDWNYYYPYGGLMGESTGSDAQPYKYNGKELDRTNGLDWYDYGARWYNGISWMTPDPLAEKYYDTSPYVYCANNPIRFIDPTGMFFGDYYDKDGKFLYSDKEKDNFIYVVDGGQSYKLPYDKNKFLITANIIKHESMDNAEEALWIAHTANNAKDNRAIDYRNKNNSLYDQLMDQNYSTTPASARLPISSENNSSVNMGARAAVIDVLMGGQDPTGGAVLWDGVDFMQKGLNHNKFKEYKSVTINQEAFNDYQKGIAGYSSKIKVNPLFEEGWKENTWQHKGTGKYYHLYSTGSRGATIFWNIKK